MSYLLIVIIILIILFVALKLRKTSKKLPLKNLVMLEYWHHILVQNVLFFKKLAQEEQKLFCA